MSTPGPDDAPPQSPDELGGLDPKDLFNAGLETLPPVTLPPQPVDPDVTVRVTPSSAGIKLETQQELPLPEELTALLPAGAYHVESFLGQGGMGAVYKGMQIRLKRHVAIKIMRRDMGKDHDFEARFEREAQAMAKLNHPNIVSVIDFGEAGPDYLYIVMELVDGADMMDVIRTGRMTQEMALSLLPQICDALQFAHDHGIVHRDIKPSNIMLTRDGRIKMADFGLAKRYDVESSFRTQTGTGMGTPDYAAPEQFDSHAQIDHRADIYALGVMIYQMITGSLPRGVWKPPSQRAEIDPHWDDIVSRAMQSDPKDRYQQASEVKTDVSSIPLSVVAGVCDPCGAKPSSEKSTTQPSVTPPASKRPATAKSRAPLLVGIAATALVAFSGVFFALRDTTPRSGGFQPPSDLAAEGKSTSAPQTPAPAVQNTPLLAQPLPESGWKPLFTEDEWRESRADHEFKDGLVHVHGYFRKPHASPDGAIRARLQFRDGTQGAGIVVRDSAEGQYNLTTEDGRAVSLLFGPRGRGSDWILLGNFRLPNPLKPGDSIDLELRVQGDHLLGLVNGATVINVRDNRIKASGDWGLGARKGWFESVEVQPLGAVGAAAEADEQWTDGLAEWWASPEVKRGLLNKEANGSRIVVNTSSIYVGKGRDMSVRATVRTGTGNFSWWLGLRSQQGAAYTAELLPPKASRPSAIISTTGSGSTNRRLKEFVVPPGFDGEQTHTMEFRAQGDLLTVLLNDAEVARVQDSAIMEPGRVFMSGSLGTLIEKFEYRELPAASPVSSIATKDSPSPNLPVSKSSDPKLPTGQWVKLFTKLEDLSADLRTAWENGVMTIEHKGVRTKNWMARNGAIRALVQMNPDADNTNLWFRAAAMGINQAYELGISASANKVVLRVVLPEKKGRELQAWKLQRAYSDEEWVKIELRVLDDLLTVVVDGTVLGTVRDNTLDQPGSFQIYAEEKGIFRDIEVINLDGLPEAEALRLLGVDEQGNDLRGKTEAAK